MGLVFIFVLITYYIGVSAQSEKHCIGDAAPCGSLYNPITCTDGPPISSDGSSISSCDTFIDACETLCESAGATTYNSPCQCRVTPQGCSSFGFCDNLVTCDGFATCESLANSLDCFLTKGCEWTTYNATASGDTGEDEYAVLSPTQSPTDLPTSIPTSNPSQRPSIASNNTVENNEEAAKSSVEHTIVESDELDGEGATEPTLYEGGDNISIDINGTFNATSENTPNNVPPSSSSICIWFHPIVLMISGLFIWNSMMCIQIKVLE